MPSHIIFFPTLTGSHSRSRPVSPRCINAESAKHNKDGRRSGHTGRDQHTIAATQSRLVS